jgi:hypothetical protein
MTERVWMEPKKDWPRKYGFCRYGWDQQEPGTQLSVPYRQGRTRTQECMRVSKAFCHWRKRGTWRAGAKIRVRCFDRGLLVERLV